MIFLVSLCDRGTGHLHSPPVASSAKTRILAGPIWREETWEPGMILIDAMMIAVMAWSSYNKGAYRIEILSMDEGTEENTNRVEACAYEPLHDPGLELLVPTVFRRTSKI